MHSFNQNHDGIEARRFYNEMEGAMAVGCGLFDDGDADVIKVGRGVVAAYEAWAYVSGASACWY